MKHKLLVMGIVITQILISISEKDKDCTIAICNQEKLTNSSGVCANISNLTENGAGTKLELQICPDGYSCQGVLKSNKGQRSITCSKEESVLNSTTGRAPGEICTTNSNCFSTVCSEGKCTGKNIGDACTTHKDCEVGLACINLNCEEQREKGESCSDDYECVNDNGCSILGECVKYYTLSNGSETNNASLCSSTISRSKSGKTFCDSMTLKSVKCIDSQDDSCVYSSKTDFSEVILECKCKTTSSISMRGCLKQDFLDKVHFDTSVHTTLRARRITLSKLAKNYDDHCVGRAIFGMNNWNIMTSNSKFYSFMGILYFFFSIME